MEIRIKYRILPDKRLRGYELTFPKSTKIEALKKNKI